MTERRIKWWGNYVEKVLIPGNVVDPWRRRSWSSPTAFPFWGDPKGCEVLSVIMVSVSWPGWGPCLVGFVHSPHFLRAKEAVFVSISSVPGRSFISVPNLCFCGSTLRRPPSLLNGLNQAHRFLLWVWLRCLFSLRPCILSGLHIWHPPPMRSPSSCCQQHPLCPETRELSIY